jgi:hypothetical protein
VANRLLGIGEMGLGNYQSTKVVIGKRLLILVATFLPPILMTDSSRDAAIMHGLRDRLHDTQYKSALEPGDLTWVTGAVRSSPLDLTPRLAELTESLRVVQRIEEYRKFGKRRRWETIRENEWIATDATLGGWRLLPDLIRGGDFGHRLASPCTEYRPATGAWSVKCPGADYAYDISDDDRRMSYEVTSAPAGRVSLLAEVSSAGDALTLIHADHTFKKPFAVLARGEREAHAMVQERLHGDWSWMAFWWAVTTFIAGCWMVSALRGARLLTGSELFFGSSRRAIAATTPLLGLFAISKTAFFVPAAIGAGAAALFLGFCLWFLAGNSR